jgi:hypothetical protein
LVSALRSDRGFRSVRRRGVVVNQLPPEGSRFLAEDNEEMKEVHKAFRDHPDYNPVDHPGTMKPGSTPENSPLSDILKLKPPQRAPYFQEVPFHIRWPASHPASQPIISWLADSGHLMSEEEEEELEVRSRRAAAARLPSAPQMISPEDIEDELLGNQGTDESLLSEVLGVDSPAPAPAASDKKKTKAWTAVKKSSRTKKAAVEAPAAAPVAAAEEMSLAGDEELLDSVLGDLDA